MAPGLATLKRGSIQLQRVAQKVVNGECNFLFSNLNLFNYLDQIGSRHVLAVFVVTGFVLCGVVEQSASVALRANSTSSYSAAEFAEYVENTSYITRYCQPPSNKSIVHVVRSIPHIEVGKVCLEMPEFIFLLKN